MLNLSRQSDVFKAYKHKNARIDVIGSGAVGSYVIFQLGKIGLGKNVNAWDFDLVEDQNICNQCFLFSHLGVSKVKAIQDLVKKASGSKITINQEKIESKQTFGRIVVLAVDSMKTRKEIFKQSIELHPHIKCMIETRMGAQGGRIYTINPNKIKHIEDWEKTLCNDEDVEVSACGNTISSTPTACLIASISVWQIMNFLNNNGHDDIQNEIIFETISWRIMTRKF